MFAGLSDGLPVRRRGAVDQVQMRRRKIITHIVATMPLTLRKTSTFLYRDPRADVRVLTIGAATAALPETARTRALLGLQSPAIGAMVHVEEGEIQRLEPVLPAQSAPCCIRCRHDAGLTTEGAVMPKAHQSGLR